MASNVLTWIPSLGAGGVLAFIVTALIQGWLVPGYVYERLRRQNDDLLNAVLQSTDAAKLALQTSQRRRKDEEDDR